MTIVANDNPIPTVSGRAPPAGKDPALGRRLLIYARIAWAACWAFALGPFLFAFLGYFGWSWPEAAIAIEAMSIDGFAFYRSASPWYPAFILLLAGFSILATRLAMAQLPADWQRGRGRTLLHARLLLFGLSLIGGVISIERLGHLSDLIVRNPVFGPPENDRQFRDTLLAELVRATALTDFDSEVRAALARSDFDHARVHVQAANLLRIPLRPETLQAYEQQTNWSASLLRGTWDAVRGAVTGSSDSMASFAGAFVADLTPYGDVRDITYQLGFKDTPDDLILGLSVVGLALTAATLVAPPQAVAMLSGKAAIKTATRFAKLSGGVAADIRRITGATIDTSGFRQAARNLDVSPGFAVRFVRRQGLDEFGRVSTDLYEIGRRASTGTALAVLKQADTLADLPFYRRIANGFSADAESVVTLLGKNVKLGFRVYRATGNIERQVNGFMTLLASSVTGFAVSLSGSVSGFLLKLLLKRAARNAD